MTKDSKRAVKIGKIGFAWMLSGLDHLVHFSILPYHSLARVKYDILDKIFFNYEIPDRQHVRILETLAADYVKVVKT